METIDRIEALHRIYRTNGQIFKAVFRKKNGKFRRMVCRLGVTKYVKGVGMAYSPEAHNLIPVFDMMKVDLKTGKKGQYRMINLSTLTLLLVGKEKFKVK